MRIVDSMLYTQAQTNINQAMSNVQTYTQQSSSGLAVTSPWDNPAAAGLAVEYKFQEAQFGAITQETSLATQELSTANSSLDTVQQAVTKAITLAEEMGSGPITSSQYASSVSQVTAIQSTIVGALNAQVGNRYIFGGSVDNTAPFDSAGDYSGDNAVRQVEVAPGIYQDASVQAGVAIKGDGGGQDLFAALSTLTAALQSGNSANIIAAEAPLQTALQQVVSAQSDLGANQSAIQTANTLMTNAQTAATTNVSGVLDANEINVATDLQQAQTVYQAAITASQQTFQLLSSTTEQQASGA